MSYGLSVLLKLPFSIFKYRDRYTIVADILKAVAKSNRGIRKTQIMQRANLNSDLLNKYLDMLIRNHYIIIDGYTYKLTSRGMQFLQSFEAEAMKLQYRV